MGDLTDSKDRLSVLEMDASALMEKGGDGRIEIDTESCRNVYGCSASPRMVLGYSSSTASNISRQAYAHTVRRKNRLRVLARQLGLYEAYKDAFENARSRFRLFYALPPELDIAFGPSGTDLELLVLALALLAEEGRVHNIIVDSEEVGSGIKYAATGRYWDRKTALCGKAHVGDVVPGFSNSAISMANIKIRDELGLSRGSDEVNGDILDEVFRAIASGARPIIHVVHRSKTGLLVPSLAKLKSALVEVRDKVDIVVDACQGRICSSQLRDYLLDGSMVIWTGSKFIGGAPFSGALIVPPRIADRARGEKILPLGLSGFFTRAELPKEWRAAELALSREENVGLLLRLESGLFELGRLNGFSEKDIRKVIVAFQQALVSVVQHSGFLKLLAPTPPSGLGDEGLGNALEEDTIYTLIIDALHPCTGEPLDFRDAQELYRALFSDLSSGASDDAGILSSIVHVGQPVKVARMASGQWQANVRVALGAPMINNMAMLGREAIRKRFTSDFLVLVRKMKKAISLLSDVDGKVSGAGC